MSYTPPAGDEADLQFAGVYVPFAGNRADLTFEELAAGATRAQGIAPTTTFGSPRVLVAATGWLATHFGTPATKVTAYATGFTPTTFGTPRWGVNTQHTSSAPSTTFGTAAIVPHVMPIYNTRFGTPNSPYLQTCVVSGWTEAGVGDGHRLITGTCITFPWPVSTTFSLAYTAANQTATAEGAVNTRFGAARLQVLPTITIDHVGIADGWLATTFGTPISPYTQARRAQGFMWTRYGWPRSRTAMSFSRFGTPRSYFTTQASAAAPATAFGTPIVPSTVTALAPGTVFGTPGTRRGYLARSLPYQAHLGTPAAFLFGHRGFGFSSTRLGTPTGGEPFNTAAGWSATVLGTPTSRRNHVATHIPPTAQLGVATLRRNPAC